MAAGQKVNIGGTAVFKTFDVPPGAHLTIGTPVTLPHVIVPKGTTVTEHGTAVVDGVDSAGRHDANHPRHGPAR